MKKILYTFLFTISVLTAEEIDLGQPKFDPDCVNYEKSISLDGPSLRIDVDFKIKSGYHIYSMDTLTTISPTKISLPDKFFSTEQYFEPVTVADTQFYFEPEDPDYYSLYDLNYYHKGDVLVSKVFDFNDDIDINDSEFLAETIIPCTLAYQACNPFVCVPGGEVFFISLDGNQVENYNPISSSNAIDLESIQSDGFFSFILFAIGMGFLALLTPCVFPMIPITVSFFTKEGERENSNPIFSASFYAISIVFIFTFLGLVLSVVLGENGANIIAQDPWVNLFIAMLFVYFAFSLFGAYEIQAPSFIRQFSLSKESSSGLLGIFFMALTFTLTSFTCTVQFIGLLLVSASQGSFFWPIIGMLAFSSAFAFPFFFLALFPQYLSKLPKSGGWLNSVKVTMGFLEMGAAMKFFSNADVVWEIGFFNREFVLISWIVLSIMIAIYLLGLIRLPHDSKLESVSVSRLMLSMSFFMFALYLSFGLYGGKINGDIESYLPVRVDGYSASFDSNDTHSEKWFSDYDDAVKQSEMNGKPIFIDFTGKTCVNCRWMETNIFTKKQVADLFDSFNLVQLYTDDDTDGEKNSALQKKYGPPALPLYVIVDTDGEMINSFIGMDRDVNNFVRFLESGLR